MKSVTHDASAHTPSNGLLSHSGEDSLINMKRNKIASQVGFTVFALAVLCSPAFSADLAKGKALYEGLCQSCHGATGAGDGPVGAALPPEMKPRDLKDGKMKFATDDAKFMEMLKKGGGAVGLNALMPAQSQLSDEEMKNVIAYVRALHK